MASPVETPRDTEGPARISGVLGHHLFEEYVDTGLVTFQAAGLTVRTAQGEKLLDDVSFSLEESAFLALVGPSGAGKSTLVNALTGFRPAQHGKILYGGRDLYGDYDELRSRIGSVPQEDVLHAPLTVRQELGYAAQLRFPSDIGEGERGRRVDEVIEERDLEERRDVPIHQLSGGQRRRVAVALELITRPSLIFLDEPTSGLDPGYERSLMTLLRELSEGGRTVVVVTHSVQSLRLCDRVLFLAPGGRTAYFGPPQLALAYFDREDFQQVFHDLSTDAERDWKEAFLASPYHERYVERPGHVERPRDEDHLGSSPRRLPVLSSPTRWLALFWMLTRRYANVLASDRRNLVLLMLQPLVLGLLMLAALPANELAAPASGEVRAVSRAGLVLLIVVLGTTWLGASNAVREIVKELPIFRRERAVGLSVSAYVASKVVVLGGLTAAQSAILVPIALARQGSHDTGSVLPSPLLELMVAATLAGVAAMALGLLISALSSTVDRAMTVLPVVLILQMLLAMGGVFPDVVNKSVLEQSSYLAGAQWAFSASASTVDLGRLQSLDKVAREAPTVRLEDPLGQFSDLGGRLRTDRRWDHEPGAWWSSAGALAGLALALTVGAGLTLRRHRPEA